MATNVLICDDSSFARKQMKRALPDGWDIEVHFASDGVEGVEAIRQGKGEVVFLDLTMPNLDGYGVLETIRREDLPAMVIGVSGDIQPMMQEKVMSLGALGFIEKPIKRNVLTSVLQRFGFILPDTYKPAIAV